MSQFEKAPTPLGVEPKCSLCGKQPASPARHKATRGGVWVCEGDDCRRLVEIPQPSQALQRDLHRIGRFY